MASPQNGAEEPRSMSRSGFRPSVAQLAVAVVAAGVGLIVGVLASVAVRQPEEVSQLTAVASSDPTTVNRRQQLGGVRIVTAEAGSLSQSITAPGVVKYDERRVVDVNLRVSGWIHDLYVNVPGQSVEIGDPLFTLQSPELLALQTQLLGALRTRDATVRSQDQQAYSARLVETPREQLLRAGVPRDQVDVIETTREPLLTTLFRSPARGVVIDTNVVKGMHVDVGQSLFRVVDLSTLSVEGSFYRSEISQLRVGTPAHIEVDASPEARFAGRVTTLDPAVDAQSGSLKVRVGVANPNYRLRPGMFVRIEVMETNRAGLLVPADAVLDHGGESTVFVYEGDGFFQPRRVTVAARRDGQALIAAGLSAGERVVARAAFLIDTASNVRAAVESYEAQSAAERPASVTSANLDLAVTIAPSPLVVGYAAVSVKVRTAAGQPVDDAVVRIVAVMPAMPSMNMPQMQTEAELQQAEPGRYAGRLSIPMTGHWDLEITASRPNRLKANYRTSVVAH
jgi:RND family efflux transporter MFP subunit